MKKYIAIMILLTIVLVLICLLINYKVSNNKLDTNIDIQKVEDYSKLDERLVLKPSNRFINKLEDREEPSEEKTEQLIKKETIEEETNRIENKIESEKIIENKTIDKNEINNENKEEKTGKIKPNKSEFNTKEIDNYKKDLSVEDTTESEVSDTTEDAEIDIFDGINFDNMTDEEILNFFNFEEEINYNIETGNVL